jgi:methyl-accepting chemotaxis protein
MDELLTGLDSRAVSDEGKRMMQDMHARVDEYRSLRTALIAAQVVPGSPIETLPEAKAIHKSGDDLSRVFDGVGSLAMKAAEDHMTQQHELVVHEVVTAGIVVLLILLLTSLFAARIIRKIAWRLGKLVDEAHAIAGGDLTTPIMILNNDEIGQVASSFEKMRQSMQEAMSEISVAASQVASGAKNVSDASVALSQGAAEQASSVEELSASLEEISSQTASNADSAKQADELTQKACGQARQGDEDMQAMLAAMEAINVSSANISKIIKVIDEIAFQTNILALNAAVEAARAGQHGKGFAVVAEEVRNLAARSAKAAKETTDMIEDSIHKVDDGRAIASKTAEALQVISSHVTEVTQLVGGIAKASQEQKLSLEQINQGVSQVSQVVQGNSATSEETASASEELSAQANRLQETAGQFSLGRAADMQPVASTAPYGAATQQAPAPTAAKKMDFGKY